MSYKNLVGFYKNAPKLNFKNVSELPKIAKNNLKIHGQKTKLGHRGSKEFQNYPPLGTIAKLRPFYVTSPNEGYNKDRANRRHYLRISLLQIQRMIDMNRIDLNSPIDLTSILNTKLFKIDPMEDRNYGIHLTGEGIDDFSAPNLNIEVQYADELAIAGVEKAGGVITTRFYDLFSIYAKSDPEHFFSLGIPIPRGRLPPQDALEYYCDERNRGYLANPEKIAEARIWLAQKYGYPVCDLSKSAEKANVLKMKKDIHQIFHGLQSDWIVNLVDKTVLKPRNT